MSLHATGQHPVIRAATEPGTPSPPPASTILSPEALISELTARVFAELDARRRTSDVPRVEASDDAAPTPRPAQGTRRVSTLWVLLALLVALPIAYVGVSTYRSMTAERAAMAARIEAFEAHEEQQRIAQAEQNHQELLTELQQLTNKMGALTEDLERLRQSLDAAWHVISPPDGVSSASKRAPTHPTR